LSPTSHLSSTGSSIVEIRLGRASCPGSRFSPSGTTATAVWSSAGGTGSCSLLAEHRDSHPQFDSRDKFITQEVCHTSEIWHDVCRPILVVSRYAGGDDDITGASFKMSWQRVDCAAAEGHSVGKKFVLYRTIPRGSARTGWLLR